MAAEDVDVIVLRSGATGLTAAFAAAREGARTAVFDKGPRLVGTSAWPGGHARTARSVAVIDGGGAVGWCPLRLPEHDDWLGMPTDELQRTRERWNGTRGGGRDREISTAWRRRTTGGGATRTADQPPGP